MLPRNLLTLAWVFGALGLNCTVSLAAEPQIFSRIPGFAPPITAKSAILVDAETGQVLYERSADIPRPPASTTKIMTAILLLEHTQPEDRIRASSRAVQVTGSSLNLTKNETVSARDMLYALLLRSANDGCTAVAEHIAGSVEKFIPMMNSKAKEIGCLQTTFANPHGLNNKAHLTTARDLALMARYAMGIPEFAEAVRTKYQQIARSPENKDTYLKNHAKFLWKYAGADGIKTGYTVPAGKCFVGSASRKGWRLISVVLNSEDWVADTVQLMDYGFGRFERKVVVNAGAFHSVAKVTGGSAKQVGLVASRPLAVVAPRGKSVGWQLVAKPGSAAAPIRAGQSMGILQLQVAGKPAAFAELLAASNIEAVRPSPRTSPPWLLMGVLGTVGIAYATTTSKSARRRRNRLAPFVRGIDQGGPG